MADEDPPFRLLSNDEFLQLSSEEKSAYVNRAAAYLASLMQHRHDGPHARRPYTGPERRQSPPGTRYDGPERRAAG